MQRVSRVDEPAGVLSHSLQNCYICITNVLINVLSMSKKYIDDDFVGAYLI